MNEIRVLIVDDEPVARRGMRRYLEERTRACIVGECAHGQEAVTAIEALAPDLVFLDIQMPEVDGFEVIEQVGARQMPAVIFVTAYDQYALQAFEAHALDYLLKPIDPERLRQAYERAADRIRRDQAASLNDQLQNVLRYMEAQQQAQTPPADDTRLVVKDHGRIYFLDVLDIQWIEAAGNYVFLHVEGNKHLLRETMTALENRLRPYQYIRINRSILINLRFVKELRQRQKGRYLVLLKDGTQLTSSRHYRVNLEGLF